MKRGNGKGQFCKKAKGKHPKIPQNKQLLVLRD